MILLKHTVGYCLLFVIISILTGCRENNFLDRFADWGEMPLEEWVSLEDSMVSGQISMVRIGENLVWNQRMGYDSIFYCKLHLPDGRASRVIEQRTDPGMPVFPKELFTCGDSLCLAFDRMYPCYSHLEWEDSLKIGNHEIKINNADKLNWRVSRPGISSVYPGEEKMWFVGNCQLKENVYGVYDCENGLLYPSDLCPALSEEDLKCVWPDDQYACLVVKQPGSNRYMTFRTYYQSYDVTELAVNSIRLVKRNIFHHSLLTWKDLMNLEKDIKHVFFPGLAFAFKEAVWVYYQANGPKRHCYFLKLNWEGKPLGRVSVPQEVKVKACCGGNPERACLIGRSSCGQGFIYKINWKDVPKK